MIKYSFFRIVLSFLVRLRPCVPVELTMSLTAWAIDSRQFGLVLNKVIVTVAALDPA